MWLTLAPATPVLMMDAKNFGITTSPITSMIMHSGPRMKYFL